MNDLVLIELQRQNRRLKQILFIGSIAGASLVTLAAKSVIQNQKFTEIDVERINIVMPDGKKELVISNRLRVPAPIHDGKELARSGPARPGLIFYDSLGNENGGLIFDGKLDEKGKPSAGMHFSMDRFGGDQQLALVNYEAQGSIESGLKVFDRGLMNDYKPIQDKMEKLPEGPEKDELRKQWVAAGGPQTTRMFVGKTRGKSSAVILADTKGTPRIMMLVTPEGEPSLEFMDEQGKVIQRLPDLGQKK
ncbi:MAG: hypothetical protein EOP07_10265 [Proteobacteria bacterium]|nr:MAG: hypothetical protein EOP07_10265 [Pseudomonadota bacterium]